MRAADDPKNPSLRRFAGGKILTSRETVPHTPSQWPRLTGAVRHGQRPTRPPSQAGAEPSDIDADGSYVPEYPEMIKTLAKASLTAADYSVIATLALMVTVSVANAFTAPAAGDLGYDIYDIVVNQGVKGPLGFVGGVAAFLFGVSRLFSNIMIGIPTIVAAVCLIKADSILQTFGMLI